jgi:hypothetical protein
MMEQIEGSSVTLMRAEQEWADMPLFVMKDLLFVYVCLNGSYMRLHTNGATSHGGFSWTDLKLPLEWRVDETTSALTIIGIAELAKRRLGIGI